MPQALPYVFYAAVAASTYSAVSSAQQAARDASRIGDLNAQAQLKYGQDNAAAALELSGADATALLQTGEENAAAIERQSLAEAAIAQRQAAAQLQQAQVEASAIRRQNQRMVGTQRVAFLKSGITLSGTAQDVIYDSAIEGELEALNAEYRGRVSAGNLSDQAAYAQSEGRNRASLLRSQTAREAELTGKRGEVQARLYRENASSAATLAAYEGGARARGYRAQSVGSFFSGIAAAASGPSFK